MYSVTDRRHFRRHGCPCKDPSRWPHCQAKCNCDVVFFRVWSELFHSADCQSERSRASSGLHSRQAESEDEVVQVQDYCCHLTVPHSSFLFVRVFYFLSSSLASIFEIHGNFRMASHEWSQELGKCQVKSVGRIQRSLQDSSGLTDFISLEVQS